MSDNTKIEWTDATWNPLLGCTKVSPGCDNCYAITNARIRESNPNTKVATAYAGLVQRTDAGLNWTGQVNLLDERLDQPLRWKKPRRIFVNAQSDLFHDGVSDEFIAKVWAVMATTPHHTYQILTKRHGRMRALLNSEPFMVQVADAASELQPGRLGIGWPLHNVWLGVSVENQKWADIRIPALLDTPAAVRWLSCEPLLGPVDAEIYLNPNRGIDSRGKAIDWVVVGGESGRAARPMYVSWAREIRDDCVRENVPFLFKQWGEWGPSAPIDDPLAIQVEPGMERVGKKKAGRELDGRTWDEYPTVQA